MKWKPDRLPPVAHRGTRVTAPVAGVNEAMRQIAYANTSNTPPAGVQIDWTFSDGNAGGQGSGGALAATGSTTVNITAANDAPVLDVGASPTLGSVLEGATNPSGVSIADLVVDGSITDADGGAVEAIAVTALDVSLGTWQYSVDGGTNWLTIGALVASLMVGFAVLMASFAFSFQRYFEYQIEADNE